MQNSKLNGFNSVKPCILKHEIHLRLYSYEEIQMTIFADCKTVLFPHFFFYFKNIISKNPKSCKIYCGLIFSTSHPPVCWEGSVFMNTKREHKLDQWSLRIPELESVWELTVGSFVSVRSFRDGITVTCSHLPAKATPSWLYSRELQVMCHVQNTTVSKAQERR